MKRGFKDYFAVYVGMGLSAVALMGFAYDFKDGAHITRYKSVYTIFRAGDDLCKLYPVEFITDKQNLASDHPKTLADCEDLPKGSFFDFLNVLYKNCSNLNIIP